jgi:hypothetical protein
LSSTEFADPILTWSASIANIAPALRRAKINMGKLTRNASNPHFRSRYADLAQVLRVTDGPLEDEGLLTMTVPGNHGDKIAVELVIIHVDSGEWMRGKVAVAPAKDCDPQAAVSVVTYLRRCITQSVFGLAPEDDDGNASSGRGEPAGSAPKAPRMANELFLRAAALGIISSPPSRLEFKSWMRAAGISVSDDEPLTDLHLAQIKRLLDESERVATSKP